MKKLLIIVVVLIGFESQAQYADQDNRFNQSNTEATVQQPEGASDANVDYKRGNPGNPAPGSAPIDDYIPLLMMAGVGLILYMTKRKKLKIN